MPRIDTKLLAQLRSDTPNCEKLIHFNNAGAALQPQVVYQSVLAHLELEYQLGGYQAATNASSDIQNFYQSLASLLNCNRNEIAYVENATRAWDMAVYAIDFKPGDIVLTAKSEYVSNYLALMHLAKTKGIEIQIIPNDEYGQVSVEALSEALNGTLNNEVNSKVKLVAITHVPTQGGLINPAKAIGELLKNHKALYLLDACQSVGQLHLDVNDIACDILCGTGRKFLRGPRGTGFLYVSQRVVENLNPPFVDLQSAQWLDIDHYVLHANAQRFETWEGHMAGKIGLGCAIDYALAIGLLNIEARVVSLGAALRKKLSSIPGVELHDLGKQQCGIVSFTKHGVAPSELCAFLVEQGVNTSVSSGAYARLDLPERGIDDLLRASLHYYNNENEIERFCELVESA
ncbi:MAG: cysteine desulfurase/selenocysteine lyase [Flavobacteriales bacterium]|jgi:cysteine desulfurase/selenocysteine lyase